MQVNVQLTIGNPVEAIQVLAVLGGLQNTLAGLQYDMQAAEAANPANAAKGTDAPPSLVDASGQPVSAEAEAQKPPVAEVGFGDVEQALQRYAKNHGIPAVKAILADMGVERARQLDQSQYAEFIARCSA